jgi:hypothetical protein
MGMSGQWARSSSCPGAGSPSIASDKRLVILTLVLPFAVEPPPGLLDASARNIEAWLGGAIEAHVRGTNAPIRRQAAGAAPSSKSPEAGTVKGSIACSAGVKAEFGLNRKQVTE